MNLAKFRIPLILIIVGAALVVIGLVFKSLQLGVGFLQANTLVLIGGCIEIIAAILAIIILIKSKK